MRLKTVTATPAEANSTDPSRKKTFYHVKKDHEFLRLCFQTANDIVPNLPRYAVSINCENGSIACATIAGTARRMSSFLTLVLSWVPPTGSPTKLLKQKLLH
jgi:hypothetical protein